MTNDNQDSASGLPPEAEAPAGETSFSSGEPVPVPPPAPAEAPAEEPVPTPEPAPKNHELTAEAFSYYDKGIDDLKPSEPYIPLVAASGPKTFEKLVDSRGQIKDDSQASKRWSSVLENSMNYAVVGDMYASTLARDGSHWLQHLQTEKGKIAFAAPKVAEKEGVKLTGERALLRIRALTGMGGLITVPLWHSGFHITLKTPSESALIELRRRLVESKIELGRSTHGLAFANTTAYTTEWLVSMALDHMYETSLKDETDIRSKIKAPDISILIWGLACAIWPNGFQFVRSLLDPKGIAERQVVAGRVNVGKLLWVDNGSFTQKQKNHMTMRVSGSISEEARQVYLDEFKLAKGRVIEINENLKLALHTPSATQFINSGHEWVEGIVSMLEAAFIADDDLNTRNKAIADHANATLLRQYAHWIEYLIVDGDEIRDPEVLPKAIDMLAENTEIREKIIKQITDFINDVTVSLIGIPEPSGADTGLPRFNRIIPIDPLSTFFTLLMHRVNLILTR